MERPLSPIEMLKLGRKQGLRVIQCKVCEAYSFTKQPADTCGRMRCMVEAGYTMPVEDPHDWTYEQAQRLVREWEQSLD